MFTIEGAKFGATRSHNALTACGSVAHRTSGSMALHIAAMVLLVGYAGADRGGSLSLSILLLRGPGTVVCDNAVSFAGCPCGPLIAACSDYLGGASDCCSASGQCGNSTEVRDG